MGRIKSLAYKLNMTNNKNYFHILYKDEHLVAIDKPAGYSVHPPEDKTIRISKHSNCMALLRDQLGVYVYPVHRLDRATSGVLLFALNKEAASKMSGAFTIHEVRKKYLCVIRGWPKENSGIIDKPLNNLDEETLLESRTSYECLKKIELPFSTDPKFETTRYSLVETSPLTGRTHQIRRHFRSLSHPLIGDTRHGSTKHNRLFAEKFETKEESIAS